MSDADFQYRRLVNEVTVHGEIRDTRSGYVASQFSPSKFIYDMSDGTAPLLTGKMVATQSVVGELLWFLGGDHSIHQLQLRTWGVASDRQTIWTPDQERWFKTLSPETQALLKYTDDLGRTYGRQWRNSAGKFGTEVDQIQKLIKDLKENPTSRYHIVNSWNAAEIDANMMALAPCHTFFQCYVSNGGALSLQWYQRSVDVFLGLPFNIASYGLLLAILAQLTGLKRGKLIGVFGDTHVYHDHERAIKKYADNTHYPAPQLILPAFSTLEEVEKMNALDFKDAFVNYQHAGKISAPLSVG